MFDTAAKSMFATPESLAQVLVSKQRASAGVHNLASASALEVRKSFQHLFLNAGQVRRLPKVFAVVLRKCWRQRRAQVWVSESASRPQPKGSRFCKAFVNFSEGAFSSGLSVAVGA